MQLKFFTVPVSSEGCEEDLNRFLRSVKVIEIRREFVVAGEGAYWAICVLYLPHAQAEHPAQPAKSGGGSKTRVDYREVLSPDDFNLFSELRKIRKEISEREAVPPYVVFTDAELAEIVNMKECTPASLKKIKGVGQGRIDKYGVTFCEMASPLYFAGKGGEVYEEGGVAF